jgi:hypothetical protein
MSKKLTLPGQPQAQVVLSDPDHEAGDRVYRLIAPTRSVKKQLGETSKKINALVEADPEPDDFVDQVTRLWCDELNLLLSGGEGAPPAGDLLFDGYMADRVTDDQIRKLHTGLAEAVADPT